MISYKYRAYPTPAQNGFLKNQLKLHCELYNKALENRKVAYEATGKSPSCFDQIKTLLKTFDRQNGNCASFQQTIRRADKTYQAFFRRKYGHPKLKKFFSTLEFSSYGDGWKIKDGKLYVQGLGILKVCWHRIMFGSPKHLNITKRGNKVYISIATEDNLTSSSPTRHPTNKIGIDPGIKDFLTLSSGERIQHPLPLKKKLKQLRKLYRQRAKSKKGFAKYRKRNIAIAKTFAKINNQRKDFLHKLTHRLVKENSFIAVEDTKNLINAGNPNFAGKKHTNRKLNDLGIGMFLNFLSYKAQAAGVPLVRVPSPYTSQICSNCGNRVEKTVKERLHVCKFCGYTEDRDVNAAKTILKLAEDPTFGSKICFESGVTDSNKFESRSIDSDNKCMLTC